MANNRKTPPDLVIRPRDRSFRCDTHNPRWWVGNDPIATAYYNAFSASFPTVERYFIEALRRYRDRAGPQLQKEITAKLTNYVKEGPVVSVAVTEVNSYRFTVGGNVEHGGIFTAKYYVTVSEAVAMGGGLNKFANPHKLVIVRNDGHSVRRVPIDYERVASGMHPEEDLPLVAGDSLFVP